MSLTNTARLFSRFSPQQIICNQNQTHHLSLRSYAIPHTTAQRIALKGAKQPPTTRPMNGTSSFVFSRPMLAAWATCCIFFGVSISLFGVDQGWITFVGKSKQDTLEANPDKESEQDNAPTEDLESEIKAQITDMLLQTDVAKSCLESPDEWKRIPFFWSKDNSSKSSAFIPGTLHGPGKLSVEPIVFLNRDRKQFIVILHIGKRLCGHSGIVHGGVLATLFDDITARPAFWNLPRNIAFTASLKINYRRPVLADQVLVCKTQLAKLEGRKGSITAQLEDIKGNLLSDAEVLYVSPSNEKMLPDAASMIKLIESVYPGNF